MSTSSPAARAPAPSGAGRSRTVFAATRWSIVVRAGRNDTPRARRALATLCQAYWYPLYAQVRRRGYSAHDAQDLTQAFFARLLEHGTLAAADPQRGRFRSFLLGSLKHFMVDEWSRARALKRGGGREIVSLDLAAAEMRLGAEPADRGSPDKAFDRQWALALLDTVLHRLEAEYDRAARSELFAVLKPTLAGPRESQPYAELATRLGLNEGAVKVAVHRLRKRYRELLQEEIADTVASPADEMDELHHLFRVLGESS